MRRIALATLLLLAAGAALSLLLGADRDSGPTAASPPPERAPSASAPAEASTPLALQPAEEVGPEEIERAAVAVEAGTPEAAATPEPPAVGGRIVLLADGVRLERESGTATVAVWRERSGVHQEVEVSDGRFELPDELVRGEPITKLALESARLGGVPVRPLPDQNRHAEGEWILVAETVAQTMLKVVSATDGADLLDVSFYEPSTRFGWFEPNSNLHPLSGRKAPRRVFGPLDSPLRLEPTPKVAGRGVWSVIVGAPGFAWKTASIPLGAEAPEDNAVVLQPGGAVHVTVDGVWPEAGLTLRLLHGDGLAYQRSLREDVDFTFEGLLPGEWRASAERGEEYWEAKSFGEATFTVNPGETAEVAIEVEPEAVERATLCEVSVELVLDGAWGLERTRWKLARLEAEDGEHFERWGHSELEISENGTLRSASPIEFRGATGEYGLHLREVGTALLFQVDRSGPVALSVAEPVEFVVEAVAGWAEVPLDPLGVLLHPVDGMRLGGHSVESLERIEGTNEFRGRAPAGEIKLSVSGDGVAQALNTYELREPDQRIRIELRQNAEVEIRLLHGEEVLTLPQLSRAVRVQEPDGTPVRAGSTRRGDIRAMTLGESGVFRFIPPDIDGYTTPPAQEHRVVTGDRSTLEFQYTRKF